MLNWHLDLIVYTFKGQTQKKRKDFTVKDSLFKVESWLVDKTVEEFRIVECSSALWTRISHDRFDSSIKICHSRTSEHINISFDYGEMYASYEPIFITETISSSKNWGRHIRVD